MSLPKPKSQSSFFDVDFLADGLFAPDDPYRLFRKKIGPALRRARAALEGLYCAGNGRPGIDPAVLAGVSLLQFMEKVPDRQAARQARLHLGWKYALDLEVDWESFDASTLSVFRRRLLAGGRSAVVFDALVAELEAAGLIERRRQRFDSTHVLGCVSAMSRLECVRETARLWIAAMERALDEGQRPERWAQWVERYVEMTVDWPGQTVAQLQAHMRQAGEDIEAMLVWLDGPGEAWRDEACSLLLRRAFGEQAPTGWQRRTKESR